MPTWDYYLPFSSSKKSQQFLACLQNQMLVVFSIYKVLFSNLGLLVPIVHMPMPNFTKFATIINFLRYALLANSNFVILVGS
jgi:hypothetical protein